MKRRLLSVIMAAMLAVSCAAPLVYAEETTDEVYIEETEDYTDYASDDAVEEIYTEETEPAYESDELEVAEDGSEEAAEEAETEAAEDEYVAEDENEEGVTDDLEASEEPAFGAFTAIWEGTEYGTEESRNIEYHVQPNEPTTLELSISKEDEGEFLFITWTLIDEESGEREVLDEAYESESCTITTDTNKKIEVSITDMPFDNNERLYARIIVDGSGNAESDVESGEEPVPDDGEFEVTTDLEDWELDMWDSDSMELTVNVESTYDSAVSYEWRKNGEVIEGAADDSYTATEGGLYSVRAYDDLGHEGTVDFKVSAERDIGAGWTCGEDIEVPANQELKLSVDTTGITKDVTFSWTFHDNDSIEPQEIGEGSSELIIGADDLKSGAYVCEVSDGYNYQRIYYSVAVVNHLKAVVEHPDEDTESTETVAVPYGKTARLKAIVTADDMDGIVYKWSDNDHNIDYDVNEDTIEIENITEARFIQLKVTDKYGNNEYLYYNIRVDNHFTASAEEQKIATYKYVAVYNAPLTLKVYANADDMEGLTYRWFDEDEHNLEGGTKSSVSIGLDKLKMMAPGKKKHYVCEVTDKFGSWTRVVFRVEMKKLLVFDKTALTIGLTKTGTVNATMAATDKIVNVVPSNKNVATATWSGNKITVKAGTVGGSTNIAVKTASGKVVKFKVTVPKPVLSFASGSKAISMTSALDLKKSKSAIVTAKLADGDSIAKVAPSNKCVTCKWSGNKITVTAGKTAGSVNVAVKTKCGKVVKFKVNVK